MIQFFASHPTAANLLMLILMIIGLIALPQLTRETFPDFTPPEVEIKVPYPGATPEDIVDAICQRIEDAIDGIDYVAELRCEAQENLSTTVVKMQEGQDFDRFMADIKTEVEAIDDFPEETEKVVIKPLNQTDPVIALAVTGDMYITDLKAYAEQIKDKLIQHPLIALVEVQGFSERQIRIELDRYTLQKYGLSVNEVAQLISRQNIDLPGGRIETQDKEILLRFMDERQKPADYADLLILGNLEGANIRLGDIATIEDQFADEEQKILFNGRRAAILQISKSKSEDALTVLDAVKNFVDQQKQIAPPSVEFHLTRDSASIVRDRLQLLLKNGWQGLLLVALTLALFFNVRFAFWVVMGLPVSFLGTLFFMSLMGYSLNMITMVGLLIAIGLLMDDAIVIAENIATHLQKGKSALQAAIDGTWEVSVGVISSFLTTLSIFLPLAFLEGDIGKVLRVMPVALLLTLTVSLIEAFFILPHHLAHALHKGEGKPKRFRKKFNDMFDWSRENLLGKTVDWVINWRYLFLGVVIAIFLTSIGMLAGGKIKFQAFPDIDGDVVEARILLPQGTSLTRTEAIVAQVEQALAEVNYDLTSKYSSPGNCIVKHIQTQFGKNIDAHETGSHVATLTVDLLTAEKRNLPIDIIIQHWQAKVGELPDVIDINYTEPQLGPAGLPIEIWLQGNDLEKLNLASYELKAWLSRYQGTFNLMTDLRPGKPEIHLRLKEGALALGLDAATIATQLRAAFYGQTASEIQVGSEAYEVNIRLAATDRDSLADLDEFTLTTQTGLQVPLNLVAEIEKGRGYARIHRINRQYTVTIQGNVNPKRINVKEMITHTQENFLPQLQATYPGITVSIQGESAEGQTTQASIQRGFLVGLIGVFVLLSFQFRSYIEPLTVMLAIPFSLIGVVWGHWLMGLDLSMPSMVGFVSLAGIVVNDSILLVTFLKMRAQMGSLVHDAARLASRDRFRAVLLTSLTTIAGLLPLLSEKSLQAQILVPLVTSLVFGLIASTLLILLVIPALYSIFEDFGWTTAGKEI